MSPLAPGVHPLHAVFLEEYWVPQIAHRSGECPVGASGCGIAVRGQAFKASPVSKIPQLAGVDLIHGLTVRHTVPAAPQSVAALHHEIHLRHSAANGHRRLLGCVPCHDPGEDHPVLPCRLQDLLPIESCRSAAGDRHTVPGGESLPQQVRLQLYAHILQGRPALLAVLPQHRLCSGYIHPQRPLLRILRCPDTLNHAAVGLALRITQADGHSRRCGSFAFQAAVVRQILGIEIHLVGKNDQICAHADQILFPLCQHRPRRLTVYADPRAVHPDQGILRRQAAGLCHRSNQAPCLPRPQGRVSLPAQVPHLTESPDSGCFPAVKAREIRHRHLFQSNFL